MIPLEANHNMVVLPHNAQQVVSELFMFIGSSFGWSRSFRNSARVLLESKVLIFIYLDLFLLIIRIGSLMIFWRRWPNQSSHGEDCEYSRSEKSMR